MAEWISTTGNPTMAVYHGPTELYIVYAILGPYDAVSGQDKIDINLARMVKN